MFDYRELKWSVVFQHFLFRTLELAAVTRIKRAFDIAFFIFNFPFRRAKLFVFFFIACCYCYYYFFFVLFFRVLFFLAAIPGPETQSSRRVVLERQLRVWFLLRVSFAFAHVLFIFDHIAHFFSIFFHVLKHLLPNRSRLLHRRRRQLHARQRRHQPPHGRPILSFRQTQRKRLENSLGRVHPAFLPRRNRELQYLHRVFVVHFFLYLFLFLDVLVVVVGGRGRRRRISFHRTFLLRLFLILLFRLFLVLLLCPFSRLSRRRCRFLPLLLAYCFCCLFPSSSSSLFAFLLLLLPLPVFFFLFDGNNVSFVPSVHQRRPDRLLFLVVVLVRASFSSS